MSEASVNIIHGPIAKCTKIEMIPQTNKKKTQKVSYPFNFRFKPPVSCSKKHSPLTKLIKTLKSETK